MIRLCAGQNRNSISQVIYPWKRVSPIQILDKIPTDKQFSSVENDFLYYNFPFWPKMSIYQSPHCKHFGTDWVTATLFWLNPSFSTVNSHLLTSSVFPLAEFLGICPQFHSGGISESPSYSHTPAPPWRRSDKLIWKPHSARKIIYFHENQLVYPVQQVKERDFQYGQDSLKSSCSLLII